ncbi:ankyrin repeat and KH domain-containing protein 1-like [Neocloeon triangulifer]|uniref:ankyrin repeat and KH domain-containing protein 1-like n=1 Tax=Neocloeon triangulifer TaxID=2078957 RepID=UPI00286F88FB|nr:ankyrin repeat and KH domain-containing protein 1-like [Neocloeon triangulifer]
MGSLDELFSAIHHGNVSQVVELRKKGLNINQIGKAGFTPLGAAVQSGQISVVRALLTLKNESSSRSRNMGYYVYQFDENENNPQSSSSHHQAEEEMVRTPDGMESLEWDRELPGEEQAEEAEEDSYASLYRWYASILERTGHVLPQEPILENIDVNATDVYFRTALHYAAELGNEDIIKELLNAGCKADVGDSNEVKPLLLASARGHTGAAALLLARGAHPEAKGPDKSSALHAACARGFTEVAEVLLDGGARIDAMDSSDRTPLYLAVSRGHEDTVQMLIRRGARINLEEIHGYNALCEAVWQKKPRLVCLLLESGAKITHSHRLLHHCVLLRQLEIVQLLLQAGALANLRDDSGDTPLLLAVRTGQLDMVTLLLGNGAIVNCSNSVTGHSVLHEAVSHDFPTFLRLLECLRAHGASLDSEALTTGDSALCRALLLGRGRAAAALVRRGANTNLRVPIAGDTIDWAYRKTRRPSLIRTLVLAGWHSRILPSTIRNCPDEALGNWLQTVSTNPLSLCEIARLTIRRILGRRIYDTADQLCLPKMLKKYLKMQDICDSDQEDDSW